MMTTAALIALAGSVSLLAGWRVYLCVLATGIAMRTGLVAAPSQVPDLAVLSSWWVMGIAALGFLAEFFVDKLAWADTLWDAIHTAIRPIGGALLSLAIVNPGDPTWQVVAMLLGGGAALASHSAKAGTRAVINTSPEPVTNVAMSGIEDIVTGGLLAVAFANPMAAAIIAGVLLVLVVSLLLWARRLLRRLFGREGQAPANSG